MSFVLTPFTLPENLHSLPNFQALPLPQGHGNCFPYEHCSTSINNKNGVHWLTHPMLMYSPFSHFLIAGWIETNMLLYHPTFGFGLFKPGHDHPTHFQGCIEPHDWPSKPIPTLADEPPAALSHDEEHSRALARPRITKLPHVGSWTDPSPTDGSLSLVTVYANKRMNYRLFTNTTVHRQFPIIHIETIKYEDYYHTMFTLLNTSSQPVETFSRLTENFPSLFHLVAWIELKLQTSFSRYLHLF